MISKKVLFSRLILIIFLCEALIMYSFHFFPELSVWAEALVDSILLSILSGILIYRFILKENADMSKMTLANALTQLNALDKVSLISTSDHNGTIIYANELFLKTTGFSREELIGKDYRILNSGYHNKEFFKDMWETLISGKTWRGEIRNKSKNGLFFWVDTIIVPITTHTEFFNYVAIRFDITKRKQLEEALQNEQVKLIHLSKLSALGEVSAGIAHEINNPLAVIAGKLTLLKRKISKKIGPEEELEKDIESIFQNINRITRIIKNLVGFSRKDSRSETPVQEDINKIFEFTLSLVQDKIKQNNIEIILESTHEKVYCITSQIEQVLVNLLNNSIYEISTLNERWIKLSAQPQGEYIEISITDSGRGIPAEIVDKLMSPFFTTKPVGQGTGLGLHISKKIIENHSGNMFYDSKCLNTRFVILLPKNKYSVLSILNIDDAKNSHINWKSKILQELKSKTRTLDPKTLSESGACSLGKWLVSYEKMFTGNQNFDHLKEAHAQFHKCAGEIVEKIHQGESNKIENLLVMTDSKYNHYSNEIILYLDMLQKEADQKASF